MTCEYKFENGACVPLRVHTIVVSTQHSEKVSLEALREDIMEKVVKAVIPSKYLDAETKYHINPCGNFVIGGPMGDAGLTGTFRQRDEQYRKTAAIVGILVDVTIDLNLLINK